MRIETGVPLSRMTTIGTGGPARAHVRPTSLPELEDALRYAAEEGLDVVVVGLGSNLLAADEGVDALVVRLEGERSVGEQLHWPKSRRAGPVRPAARPH